MNIKLLKLNTQNDLQLFCNMKKDCIFMHEKFAKNYGVIDTKSVLYNSEDASSHIGDDNYYQFLISYNDCICGVLEYKIQESDIKDGEICYINIIYLTDVARGLGIGTKIIKDLIKKYKTLELEAWYSLPAEKLYESLGFKTKYRHMIYEQLT